MNRKVNQVLYIMFVFCIMSSCVLFNIGSGIKDLQTNLKYDVPIYPSAQRINLDKDDLELLVIDSFGSNYLQDDSNTMLSWTEDMGIEVDLFFDELLTDDNWSNESGWEAGFHYLGSEWEKEDLKLSIMILYDLDSESISNLNSAYGIEGMAPGGTLIFTHVQDLSQALQKTPEKAVEEIPPPTITVRDIQSIATSSVAGDPTIWVFLPSGEIAQSDDHGKSWSKVFEPLENHQVYPGEGSDTQFTKTERGLFVKYDSYIAGPYLWYTESTIWYVVVLPENTHAVAVAQDGSGRVIAVGANPKGKEKAWILESPCGDWRPIPCEIDNWARITVVEWFPEYGIVGINSGETILHTDENYQWDAMGTHGSSLYLPGFWVAADGNLYIHNDMGKNFRWNGEKWEVFENSFKENIATLPGVADFGIGPGFDMYRSEDAGLTIDLVSVPDMPERIDVLELAVSGDGIVYLLTEAGLYMSRDAGSTWELIIDN